MRYVLLNSAMMPAEGVYRARRISRAEFVAELRRHDYESYVGYQETADHIGRIAGVTPAVSRAQTVLDGPATILVCRLAYRMTDPGAKGRQRPDDDDYEYLQVDYSP